MIIMMNNNIDVVVIAWHTRGDGSLPRSCDTFRRCRRKCFFTSHFNINNKPDMMYYFICDLKSQLFKP